MTYTDHNRWLYIRPTLLLGRRSTGVGVWYNTHGRALPTLCATPPNAPKIHGRVLWPNRSLPMTLYASHTIIGAPVDRSRYLVQHPRPCFAHRPDSSFCLHVGSRSNPIQSLNQYRIDIWLYDTFLHNKIWYFVLSCYANTLSPLCNILQININPSRILHICTRKVHPPHI